MSEKILVEAIAEKVHDQWIDFTKKAIPELKQNSTERTTWRKNWLPYVDLPEKQKAKDRIYAQKIIKEVKEYLKAYYQVEI